MCHVDDNDDDERSEHCEIGIYEIDFPSQHSSLLLDGGDSP